MKHFDGLARIGLYYLFPYWGFFNNAYHAIVSGISYVSGSVSAVLSVSLPSEVLSVIVLVVAVCIILLILGR